MRYAAPYNPVPSSPSKALTSSESTYVMDVEKSTTAEKLATTASAPRALRSRNSIGSRQTALSLLHDHGTHAAATARNAQETASNSPPAAMTAITATAVTSACWA